MQDKDNVVNYLTPLKLLQSNTKSRQKQSAIDSYHTNSSKKYGFDAEQEQYSKAYQSEYDYINRNNRQEEISDNLAATLGDSR